MKQKIEGGWRSRFEDKFLESGELWTSAYKPPVKIKMLKQFVNDDGQELIDFISTEIEKAKASERQRCVEFLRDKIEDEVIGIFNGNGLSTKEQRSRLDEILEQLK